MKCYICRQKILNGYLCKTHAMELKHMLDEKINIVINPDWRYHCQVCGEFENITILEYKNVGYFCDKDILEEYARWGGNYTRVDNITER